jgi:hypothetical protein
MPVSGGTELDTGVADAAACGTTSWEMAEAAKRQKPNASTN